jgi:hypothetical protein
MERVAGFCSSQCISLPDVPAGVFASWARPDRLGLMLEAYFAVAERTAARLARVRWLDRGPAILLLGLAGVPLIEMGRPGFELGPRRRAITVAVEGGLLVMPGSRARLIIELARGSEDVQACVHLLGYQPRAGRYAIVRWLYQRTQLRVHALVGRQYLRRLRRQWMECGRRQAHWG